MTELLIQGALSGLLIGGVYGLIALGLNLVFGTMRVINFAQGTLLMLAMFMAYWLHVLTGLHPYLSPLVTVPVLFGLGYAIQVMLITPLLARERAREPMSVLLMTLGLAILLENLALMLFRADYKTVQVGETNAVWFLGDYIVSVSRFWALVALLATVTALWAFLHHTDLGRAIRAVGQDRQVARLLGINDRVIYNYAFGISTALMGIAAAALVPFYYTHPAVGTSFLLKALSSSSSAGSAACRARLWAGSPSEQSRALSASGRRLRSRKSCSSRSSLGCCSSVPPACLALSANKGQAPCGLRSAA